MQFDTVQKVTIQLNTLNHPEKIHPASVLHLKTWSNNKSGILTSREDF